jgi:hypothetical protein
MQKHNGQEGEKACLLHNIELHIQKIIKSQKISDVDLSKKL